MSISNLTCHHMGLSAGAMGLNLSLNRGLNLLVAWSPSPLVKCKVTIFFLKQTTIKTKHESPCAVRHGAMNKPNGQFHIAHHLPADPGIPITFHLHHQPSAVDIPSKCSVLLPVKHCPVRHYGKNREKFCLTTSSGLLWSGCTSTSPWSWK